MAERTEEKISLPYENTLNRETDGGGNSTKGTTSAKHGAKMAERISAEKRYSNGGMGGQPTRQGGGNVPVTGEAHESKKAERVSAESRFNSSKVK